MDRTQLQTLLPHQGQALWLDQVLQHDQQRISGLCASSHVQRFSRLASPAYLFEAAAQLCAAHGALLALEAPDQPPIRAAFVGKLSQLNVHQQQLPHGDIQLYAEQEAVSPAGALYRFHAAFAQQPLIDGKLLLVLQRD